MFCRSGGEPTNLRSIAKCTCCIHDFLPAYFQYSPHPSWPIHISCLPRRLILSTLTTTFPPVQPTFHTPPNVCFLICFSAYLYVYLCVWFHQSSQCHALVFPLVFLVDPPFPCVACSLFSSSYSCSCPSHFVKFLMRLSFLYFTPSCHLVSMPSCLSLVLSLYTVYSVGL